MRRAMLGCVLALAACGSTDLPGLDAEDPWGKAEAGLSIRADGPSSAAQGDVVPIEVEFQVRETKLRHGRLKLDRRAPATFARLRLAPTGGGAEVVIRCADPAAGRPTPPPARGIWPTWGLANEKPDAVTISFPLARAWESAPAGGYTGVVELDYDAEAHGTWHGKVRSAPFGLTISPSSPIPTTFAAPTRLRLSGRNVFYGDEDVEQLLLELRNGFSRGLRIRQSDGGDMLHGGATLPEVPRQIGRLADDLPSGAEFRYWMELFETSDAPDHRWEPAADSGSYRTLWKREFTLRAP
jgi:hypothetical protein